MAWDERSCLKRGASADVQAGVDGQTEAAPPEKRCRSQDTTQVAAAEEVLSEAALPESIDDLAFADRLDKLSRLLESNPFHPRSGPHVWSLKRQLYEKLPRFAKQAELRKGVVQASVAGLVDDMIRFGYVQSWLDRKEMVATGAWLSCMAALEPEVATDSSAEQRAVAVHTYNHLSEWVNYYDDYSGHFPEFWNHKIFRRVLKFMSEVICSMPNDMQADQWEIICPQFEVALKCIGSYVVYWQQSKEAESFVFDIREAEDLLYGVLDNIAKFDGLFGEKISSKARGDPLEEFTRLAQVLATHVAERDERDEGEHRRGPAPVAAPVQQSSKLLNLLVKMLSLKIPTFTCPKQEAVINGTPYSTGVIPVDERQLDAEWFSTLAERCESSSVTVVPVKTEVLTQLFKAMSEMSSEEQRYRLDCVAPLLPPVIAKFAEQLKKREIPAELMDLKVVLNTVLQEDGSIAADLVDELSIYPCLLDFAAKRAMLHALSDRLKFQGNPEPVRLVVPRDNVLDGVCSTLKLQDMAARIDAPLEIEFRAGYSDSNGAEIMDEGEDQGGLRRQWLDRASRHFVTTDLFITPAEAAAHMNASSSTPSASSTAGRSRSSTVRGKIFAPSPEPVCRYVQEDWEEQFRLFGCVVGFAILYKETIPVHLAHHFLRAVFKPEADKEDTEELLASLENVDSLLHTKLKYILSGGYKALGDTLADALEQSNLPKYFELPESRCQELVGSHVLKEGGDMIEVTEEGKEEFVKLLLERLLVSGIARQVECFRQGLEKVVPADLLQRIAELMTVKEMDLMLCGADSIDVEDWERHTTYENGYSKTSKQVVWFWKAVRAMSSDSQSSLLSFTTGSSQVPSGGFRFLQPELFTIQRVAVTDRIPEAHTCANVLDLPEYESYEELERRLRFAVDEAGDYFGRR
eukprot:TRINITY_DN7550_c0_g1_i1.p1 TRINITY_DN7550_c0_g1~~TRINITY_DN7550_c0_g1_i1.p1  ORF type:complete len:917 (+),score=273.86 TRINITY_DN7550_c0_g1_i1:69-2819(+)